MSLFWPAVGAKGKRGKGRGITLSRALLMIAFACLVKGALAEEAPSAAGVSMAATLLGSISFVMCLYYFINYDDTDIQEMTWQTISSTISIFCAVLLWSSFNDLAETYVITPIFGEGDATYGALFVDLIHMLIWFAIMQVSLAFLSGAAGPYQIDHKEFEAMPEDEQEEICEKKEVNMACYSVLCAHITGFASINAFGTVQAVFFSSSPGVALLAPVVALLAMLGLQRITDGIREKISLGDDGKKDRFEDMWDDECEEAENDVMGLALSFTTISALRFLITGCLPNSEGKEEECPAGFPEEYLNHHTTSQKVLTIVLGFAFAAIIFVMRSNWPEWLEPEAIKNQPKGTFGGNRHYILMLSRLTEGVYVATSMCFSWAFFFGVQMILAGFAFFEGEPELLAVVNALVLSAICMSMIIPLDQLADADWTDEHCDTAIRSIMSSMGLLIGFGWEQCFDASVDTIAQESNGISFDLINPHTTKLALTLFCAGLLVPAWKMYMLPFIIGKGWEAEYPLKIAKKVAQEIADEKRGNKKAEETADQKAKKVKCFDELAESVRRFGQVKRQMSMQQPGESTAPYQALAGDESAESLKKQIASLKDELAKTKAQSAQEQKMLDSTMENMLSSMKQMNSTVARIEATR